MSIDDLKVNNYFLYYLYGEYFIGQKVTDTTYILNGHYSDEYSLEAFNNPSYPPKFMGNVTTTDIEEIKEANPEYFL